MSIHRRSTALLLFSGLVWTLLSGCSGDQNQDSLTRISSTGRVITVDEVMASQFKALKQYDTDDLPGASAAIYGFMKSDSDAFDYEVRFYENHVKAVELGTALAEEGSGPDAVLGESDAVFKEGVRDRRLAYGADRGAAGPKYGTYVIYENLVILCQGREAEQSFERCEYFVSELHLVNQ